MKPLGSITIFYQFLDQNTVDVLESLMRKAENYYNFVERLTEKVFYENATDELAYMAALHVSYVAQPNSMVERISSKYGHLPLVRPWTIFMRTFAERQTAQVEVPLAVDEAISTEPDDWVVFTFLLWLIFANVDNRLESIKAVDKAEKFLEEHPSLHCFSHRITSWRVRLLLDENIEQANELCKIGLEKAREMDDQHSVWRFLLWLMIGVRQEDPYRALKLNKEMYMLSRNLDIKRDQISSLNSLSFTYWTLGEFDLAVESQMNCMDIEDEYEKEYGPGDWRSNNLSVLYSDMGDGDESLTWALWAEQRYREEGGSGNPLFAVQLARANTLLGRLDEDHEFLDKSRADVLKSGTEGALGIFYGVLGRYEIATGNLEDGKYHLEQALEIAERRPSLIAMNRELSALIETEIQSFVKSGGEASQDVSGPYMLRLEEIAREKNLLGILMQHAILKADFRVVQERYGEAKAILTDALKIHDSPGVETLQRKILEKIQDLDSSRVYC